MSVLQARAAGRRDAVLRRDMPRERRPDEAGAGTSGGTSAASPRWPQAVDVLDLRPLGVVIPPRYGPCMQANVLALGPVPVEEAPARPGDSAYAARAFAQCQRFIALVRQRLGPEPDGARLGVRRSDQDFDPYLEVVLRFDDANNAARGYAARCDRDAPARWISSSCSVSREVAGPDSGAERESITL